MFSSLNRWLSTPEPETVSEYSRLEPFDLPNEIWAQIFQEPSLHKQDLVAVLTSCHHFNDLALPIILFNAGTTPSALAAGNLDITSDAVPLLNLAFRPAPISQMTCTFDIRGDSRAPRDLKALKALISRAPSPIDLRLNFLGDLLSSYKSDLVPLTPQRMITKPFCDLLSSLPRDSDAPVVFVGTEIFSCRAADIRSWQLDKYMFEDTGAGGGLSGLIRTLYRTPPRSPLRTKTTITQYNGLRTSVFPFISISSLDIQHLPGPFSSGGAPWMLVTINSGSPHWPNALSLSAPLAAAEWRAILPLLSFPNLPVLRTEPPPPEGTIPAAMLDAFLSRHPTLRRMSYYPDPLTLPAAPAFPHEALPCTRNLTTSAPGALHLFRAPEVFPNLFTVRITGAVWPDALALLARHAGHNKLILQVATGAWMAGADAGVAAAALHRVDTVVLFGVTDFVATGAVLRWVGLFPSLRRVVLQECLHADVLEHERRDFGRRARANLPQNVELISALGF
ncbi:hypothetical protein DFH09DRAFT_194473 [Mycena vulgaris]|nr:hypothetical protein DFH09DRAFT_194473 [Mycena vulgaris]